MGYRSEVAVVIETKDNDRLLEAAKDWDKEYDLDRYNTVENLIAEADQDIVTKDKKYRLISWGSIKWYAKMLDAKCYKNQEFFESLDEYGIKYDFVRIGEEMGDYDVKGNLDSGIVYPDQSLWFNEDLLEDQEQS